MAFTVKHYPNKMKAFIRYKYGEADVLQLEEVEMPVIKDDEVLVKVHANSLNAMDKHLVHGLLPSRPTMGLFRPKRKYRGLGADIAGVVEAVGSKVTKWKPGDEVFGACVHVGGFAEYAKTQEDRLALKPASLSFEDVACTPIAGITALQGLQHKRPVEAGQKVLVNGASGGVGSFAVQVAKALGAHVTAVCSTRNAEFVRSLGADVVIDYTKDNWLQNGEQYDYVFEAVGNASISELRGSLTPKGVCAMVGFTSTSKLIGYALRASGASKKQGQQFGLITITMNTEDLTELATLMEKGKIKPAIDQHFQFEETIKAMTRLIEGPVRGKITIKTH